MASRTAAGKGVFSSRGSGAGDESKGGVGCSSSGDGDGSGGDEACKGGREPWLAEREKEISRSRHSSTFRHSA